MDVEREHNGMVISALSFKIVMEDLFGIKTHGHAHVQHQQSGMENFAHKIPALEDKSGIRN